jgi:CDP-glucose 4,6-dehydratase
MVQKNITENNIPTMDMKNLFGGYYKDKVVFLTGHTGFQGTWLSLWLTLLGAKVIGYSLKPPTSPSLFNILNMKKIVTSKIGNINNKKKLTHEIFVCKPDIVMHLAAQALVVPSYQNPIETFSTNIIGTANLLESIRDISSIKSCLIMTSDKAYENKEFNCAHIENNPMGGTDPYSASKGAAELVISSYRKSFFNEKNSPGIATIRAGNVIGGGDWANYRLIPDCIKSLISKKNIILRNPRSIRPWQHVLESLSGFLLIGSKLDKNSKKFSGPWNVGPSPKNSLSVESIVKKIIHQWGAGKIITEKNNLYEAKLLKLDSSKIFNLMKWKPTYSYDESIEKTVNWYLKYHKNKKTIQNFTILQIEDYVKHAQKIKNGWIN